MAGTSQAEQEGKMPEFVERRRAALERYLNRTAAHPMFQVDPDFRDFIESGEDQFTIHPSNLNALGIGMYWTDEAMVLSLFVSGYCFFTSSVATKSAG